MKRISETGGLHTTLCSSEDVTTAFMYETQRCVLMILAFSFSCLCLTLVKSWRQEFNWENIVAVSFKNKDCILDYTNRSVASRSREEILCLYSILMGPRLEVLNLALRPPVQERH